VWHSLKTVAGPFLKTMINIEISKISFVENLFRSWEIFIITHGGNSYELKEISSNPEDSTFCGSFSKRDVKMFE